MPQSSSDHRKPDTSSPDHQSDFTKAKVDDEAMTEDWQAAQEQEQAAWKNEAQRWQQGLSIGHPRSENLFLAVVVILLGIILLLNNLGYLPWGVWGTLWRFWPIFIIMFGLRLILGPSKVAQWLLAIIASAAVIALIAFALITSQMSWYDQARQYAPWLPEPTEETRQSSSTVNVSTEDFDPSSVESKALSVELQAGKLVVADDDRQSDFLSVEASGTGSELAPNIATNLENGRLQMSLSTANQSSFWLGRGGWQYDATLGRTEIPTDISLELGAGQGDFFLDQSLLRAVQARVGAGQLRLELDRFTEQDANLNLEVGAGQLTLVLPEHIGVSLNHQVGLGNLIVFGQRLERSGQFTSEGYDQADVQLEIEAEVGVGQLEIRRK